MEDAGMDGIDVATRDSGVPLANDADPGVSHYNFRQGDFC